MQRKTLKSLSISVIMLISLICVGYADFSTDTTNNGIDSGINPFSQNYSTNSSATTSSVSVLAHQSYYNDTKINLTESDLDFTIPAPLDEDFNTSKIYLSVTNITAQNKTLIVEDDARDGVEDNIRTDEYFSSFEVINDCYLQNITAYFEANGFDDGEVHLYLLNSTWNNTLKRNVPDETIDPTKTEIGSIPNILAFSNAWYSSGNLNYYLDNSKTNNNTWFIGVYEDGLGQSDWAYVNDDDTGGDTNETYSYQWDGSNWIYLERDFLFKVGLNLGSNAPAPSDLNLLVNNTMIADSSSEINAGDIQILDEISGTAQQLNLSFDALWYDFDFQVNVTEVNYTKSNLDINTEYTVTSSQEVYWNATTEITQFEDSLTNYMINFSLPNNWNVEDVYNNTEIKSNSESIVGQSKIVTISDDASNGSWSVICTSNNLLSDMKIGVNGIETDTAYTNEILQFNASFSKDITGDVNLSIYNPSPSVELNYSKILTVLSETSNIDLGDWDIASNITQGGYFRVQVTWSNETDAAIVEKNIFVATQTSLDITPISGFENSTSNTPFNISLIYTDLFSLGAPNITGATIGYDLGLGDGWQTDSSQTNNDETYNITIDPNDFSAGQFIIPITINKTGYQNFTTSWTFNVVDETVVTNIVDSTEIVDIIRGFNATYTFSYNKSSSEVPIATGIINLVQIDNDLSWSYENLGSGLYAIQINTSQIDTGVYDCSFNISNLPSQTQEFSFQIEIIPATTNLNMIEISDSPLRSANENLTITFNLTDTDNLELIDTMPSTWISIRNNSDPLLSEWNTGDWNYFAWEVGNGVYKVNISINGLNGGPNVTHLAILNVSYNPNYVSSALEFDFKLRGNTTEFSYQEVLSISDEYVLITDSLLEHKYTIYSGTPAIKFSFNISDTTAGGTTVYNTEGEFVYNVTLISGSTIQSLENSLVFDETIGTHWGNIDLPDNLELGNYQIRIIVSQLNYEDVEITLSIQVSEQPGIEEWVLYLIIGSVLAIAAIIGVQRGIIAPRKRRYQEKVLNTASIFEDAINMQHLLVIYKGTGTCVYFKSFGMEQIDPNLLGGLMTAIQSLAKESMSGADGLGEIKFKDSTLLVSDGELIRVALVLGKDASRFLKSNLTRFLMMFEGQYQDTLANWKGQLNIFKDAEKLMDKVLHTSVILPHEISTDIKTIKSISSSLAKSLLKIARELTTGGKPMFFLAQVISTAKDQLKKKPQEILLGITELLEKEVFIPLDLSKFEAEPISEQDLKELASKVAALPNFTNDEKQTLIQDLVEMNTAEREAAITSLQQGQKITATVSKRAVKTKSFTSETDAKVEVKNLIKEAKKHIKSKEFSEAIHCYEIAEVTASNWKLMADAQKCRDLALSTQIKQFNSTIKNAKKQAPKLLKEEKNEDAQKCCEDAYESALSMFKLGFTEYDKDVKFFTKMLNEVKHETPSIKSAERQGIKDKKSLMKDQKSLAKLALKLERKKEYHKAITAYSELVVVSDKLFKFGVIAASTDLKKYKLKIAELKKKAMKAQSSEHEQIDEEKLLDQKSQLLNIALQTEQEQDYVKSLVAYQQVLNIYHTLGDSDNAAKLSEKITSIIGMISNIGEVLESITSTADSELKSGNLEQAFAQYQYAKSIAQAIDDKKILKKIEQNIQKITSN